MKNKLFQIVPLVILVILIVAAIIPTITPSYSVLEGCTTEECIKKCLETPLPAPPECARGVLLSDNGCLFDKRIQENKTLMQQCMDDYRACNSNLLVAYSWCDYIRGAVPK